MKRSLTLLLSSLSLLTLAPSIFIVSGGAVPLAADVELSPQFANAGSLAPTGDGDIELTGQTAAFDWTAGSNDKASTMTSQLTTTYSCIDHATAAQNVTWGLPLAVNYSAYTQGLSALPNLNVTMDGVTKSVAPTAESIVDPKANYGAENLTDVWGLLNTANQVKAALPSDTASLYHYTFTKNVSVSSGNRYSYADLYFKFENKAYSVFTPFGTQDFAVTRTSDGTSYSPYAYAATKNGTASFDFYTTMELTPLSWTFAVFNGYDWVYTNESFTGTLTPTSVPFLDFLTAEAKKAGISEEVYRQCLREHGYMPESLISIWQPECEFDASAPDNTIFIVLAEYEVALPGGDKAFTLSQSYSLKTTGSSDFTPPVYYYAFSFSLAKYWRGVANRSIAVTVKNGYLVYGADFTKKDSTYTYNYEDSNWGYVSFDYCTVAAPQDVWAYLIDSFGFFFTLCLTFAVPLAGMLISASTNFNGIAIVLGALSLLSGLIAMIVVLVVEGNKKKKQ